MVWPDAPGAFAPMACTAGVGHTVAPRGSDTISGPCSPTNAAPLARTTPPAASAGIRNFNGPTFTWSPNGVCALIQSAMPRPMLDTKPPAPEKMPVINPLIFPNVVLIHDHTPV